MVAQTFPDAAGIPRKLSAGAVHVNLRTSAGGELYPAGVLQTYEIVNPSTTEQTVTVTGGALMLEAQLVDLAAGLTISSGTIANRTASNVTQALLTFNPADSAERDLRLDVGNQTPTTQGLREVVPIDRAPMTWQFPTDASLTSIGVGSLIASGSVAGTCKLVLRWIAA